ncbi:hypothetical protein PFLmoz3_05493 [Pseudomonas fluorescens]|uniref:Uncharacterized protein n=1 Tax=Pseudomonas fluorescens TaxID=294 RepID=A0A109LC89_PSEFL|nr:hypothetical protein PFLmoz3_05493 [Pseudomonas fluorescens]
MTNGTDDRGNAGINCAGHHLFVEAPQVFQGATATGQDQRVETPGVGEFQRPHDLRDCFAALHGSRDQGQFNVRRAAAEYADDVANYRAGGRADNTDAPRMRRQRHFAFGTEQAFGAQLFLQCVEGQA